MEVILLEKMRNLGELGQTVKVKSGFGRNFLVPYGKAVYATADNLKKFEARRAELEKAAAEKLQAAEARKQTLEALNIITITARAGDEGKLFGSIGTREIAAAISKTGVEVAKSEIHMPMGLLRQTGEYEIEIELHSDVVMMVKIHIVPEGSAAN